MEAVSSCTDLIELISSRWKERIKQPHVQRGVGTEGVVCDTVWRSFLWSFMALKPSKRGPVGITKLSQLAPFHVKEMQDYPSSFHD